MRHIADVLGIDRGDIVDAEWADNGPGWVAVLLDSAEAVLALRPGVTDLDLGVVGPYPPGSPQAFEVRAFVPKDGGTDEDPGDRQPERVAGRVAAADRPGHRARTWPARARRSGRQGRVHVSLGDADGTIWVGGGTVTCVAGQVEL